MINFRIIFTSLGLCAIVATLLMIPSLLIEFFTSSQNYMAFLKSIIICGSFGILLIITNSYDVRKVSRKTAFILTGIVWFFMPIFCALPFYFSNYNIGIIDSIFESTSGLTTTGASIIPAVEVLDKGILMWRAVLQFVGGIGIVIFILLIIPSINKGNAYLLSTESEGGGPKLFSKTSYVILSVVITYLVFNVFCILFYWFFGMNLFDAIAHAFTTISTGGYSTHNNSLAFYQGNVMIEYGSVFFMMIGALPFMMFIYIAKERKLYKSYQVLTFLFICLVSYFVISLVYFARGDLTLEQSIRYAIFNVTTVITSTGFATNNYISMNGMNVSVLLLLGFIGSCTGSTAGGLKVARIRTIFLFARYRIKTFAADKTILTIDEKLARKIDYAIAFITFYFIFLWVGTFTVSAFGYDFLTSLSATTAVLSNTGIGVVDAIGGSGGFAFLQDEIKVVFCFLMVLGRVEFIALCTMLFPSFWKVG